MSETTGSAAPDPTHFDLPTHPDPDPVTAPATADAFDDEAAEADDTDPVDGDATDDDYTDDEPGFSGVCRGGPYDGRTVASRFPSGFLLFDKQRRLTWTYGATAERPGEYAFLASGTTSVADEESLRAAADGVELDVLAFDDGPAVT